MHRDTLLLYQDWGNSDDYFREDFTLVYGGALPPTNRGYHFMCMWSAAMTEVETIW